MPAPRVFVSSTFYDLKYIRENLKFFIKSLGYEPILSEDGAVFYDPALHTHDACVSEVTNCQLFVLIIGGRHGSSFKFGEKSITNAEYEEAIRTRIPIFALIEREVYFQYRFYNDNKANDLLDHEKISYSAVDTTKVFDFIEKVQSQVANNALVPFSDFEEVQYYLKQQWAAMMYRFLTSEGEAKRVSNILTTLTDATEKIEYFTRQVLDSIGNKVTKTKIDFYDIIIKQEVIRDLAVWNLNPSPTGIIKNETFDDFCKREIKIEDDEDYGDLSITYGGPPYKLGFNRYKRNVESYKKVREILLEKLKEKNISTEDFLEDT